MRVARKDRPATSTDLVLAMAIVRLVIGRTTEAIANVSRARHRQH